MSTKTYFINSPDASYNDNEFAWFQSLMLTEGIIGDGVTGAIGLQVIQNGTPDMSVLVGTGKALVEVTISGRTFKVVVENDAQVQKTITANSSGSNRVDAVIVRVDKDATPNALKTNVSTIEVITGSGASALSNGAIDTAVGNDGWYRLANVTVANGDSSIITAEIADTRTIVYFSNGLAFSPLFINESQIPSPQSNAVGSIPKLESDGKLSGKFMRDPIVRTYLNAASPATWTKPAGLRYIEVEVQAAGGNGGDASAASNQSSVGDGGGGGGYSKKSIPASSLGSTETITIGAVGASSSFGSHCSATSGANGTQQGAGADGGIGSGGDINIKGQGGDGTAPNLSGEQSDMSGHGGSSHLGGGGKGIFAPNNTGSNGNAGGQYGGGGGGAGANDGNSGTGGVGGAAIVIVKEFY